MSNHIQIFLKKISESFEAKTLIKLTLGNKKDKNGDLKNVFIKPVMIKNTLKLSFNFRYNTNDQVKNYDLKESLSHIEELLQTHFFNADLFTASNDFYYSSDKSGNGKILTKAPTLTIQPGNLQHDKTKNRIMNNASSGYLKDLGITGSEGHVKKDMQDKFKQINHYIEIVNGIIKDIHFGDKITVADMGSGKGYLTFALYDYLTNKLQLNASVEGIEVREDLVNKCNQIAAKNNYKNLIFKKGTIQDAAISNIDLLIALHACDTATDDAIFSGIQSGAKVIICAPCCHKQIRKQMHPENELKYITNHGILLERQAEMVTDAIRALIMEVHGYKTKVFDFIATEHTPKNVLIVGIKHKLDESKKQAHLEKIAGLKKLFNIERHYLETLF